MFTKDSKVKEGDLVLVETKPLEEKCGECGNKLVQKLFWSKEDYQQKIECEKCGLAFWRSVMKEKY